MENLKKIIGSNLAELRKKQGLTQLELADKFGYTDRAVSKWENGDTLPDIEILYELCEFYNVTIDYLTHEENKWKYIKISKDPDELKNKIIMTCLICSVIWMIATVIFVYTLINLNITQSYWMAFVWAVPVTALVLLLLNAKYLRFKPMYFWILSILTWSLLASTYLQFITLNSSSTSLWPIFIIGVPLQITIIFWIKLKKYPIFYHKQG